MSVNRGQPVLQPLHHVGIVELFAKNSECRRERIRTFADLADGVTSPAQVFQHRPGALLFRIECLRSATGGVKQWQHEAASTATIRKTKPGIQILRDFTEAPQA